MKILHVNKFFWQSGGVERYMFEVAERLKREGHESIFFSMQHPNNFASEQSRFFVSHVEYRNTSPAYKARTLLRTVGKTIYSPESRRKMEALVRAERPDLAHVHLVSHQISPSVLLALKKLNVPDPPVPQLVDLVKQMQEAFGLLRNHEESPNEEALNLLSDLSEHLAHYVEQEQEEPVDVEELVAAGAAALNDADEYLLLKEESHA